MKATTMRWICCALLATPVVAQAQVARDRAEIAQGKQELHQDRHEVRDDWRDLKRLEGVFSRLQTARRANDAATLAQVDQDLQALLGAELAEGHTELAKDHAEIRRDRQELQSERREVYRDAREVRPGEVRRDLRDLRDDRRDLRDDVRDARVEAASHVRTRRIAAELSGLSGKQDGPSLDRKQALVAELIRLARAERREDRRELREDRRELREDRRELREDRREAR